MGYKVQGESNSGGIVQDEFDTASEAINGFNAVNGTGTMRGVAVFDPAGNVIVSAGEGASLVYDDGKKKNNPAPLK